MRVLVAGATGLIGKALVPRLLEKGHDVLALGRNIEKLRSTFGEKVDVAQWDGTSHLELLPHLDREDLGIITLLGENIGEGMWTKEKKQRVLDSRVQSAEAVARAVAEAAIKPAVYVQGSAVGFYGNRGDELLDETSASGKGFLAEVTIAWEAAGAHVTEHGVRHCTARTGIVLAPGGGALKEMEKPFKMFMGGTLGSGRQWMSWIHLDDEVEALLHVLEQPDAKGPFNFTAPEPVRNAEFSKALGDVLKRPSAMPVPAFALKLAMGEKAEELLLSGQRALPKALERSHFSFRYTKVQSALADIYS
jgi:hypothetical protein